MVKPYWSASDELAEKGTVTDEQEAYNQVKAALALVSNKLNEGTARAEKGMQKMNKATKVIR